MGFMETGNMKPILIVNFKTYEQATGRKAVELAKRLETVSTDIICTVQNCDIYKVAQASSLPIFAQHIDPVEFGSNTGKDLAEALVESGAKGVIINHSEDRVDWQTVQKCVKRAKSVGLETVVCVPKPEDAKKVKADMIAFEDPELIGSGRAISEEMPDQIKKFVELCPQEAVPLCGAGISKPKDVKKALEFGTKGVLVASAIVKAEKPEQIAKNFLEV